jgi:hypothetical protein
MGGDLSDVPSGARSVVTEAKSRGYSVNDIVEAVLTSQVRIPINNKDNHGCTLFALAVKHLRWYLVQSIGMGGFSYKPDNDVLKINHITSDEKADMHAPMNSGLTPLQWLVDTWILASRPETKEAFVYAGRKLDFLMIFGGIVKYSSETELSKRYANTGDTIFTRPYSPATQSYTVANTMWQWLNHSNTECDAKNHGWCLEVGPDNSQDAKDAHIRRIADISTVFNMKKSNGISAFFQCLLNSRGRQTSDWGALAMSILKQHNGAQHIHKVFPEVISELDMDVSSGGSRGMNAFWWASLTMPESEFMQRILDALVKHIRGGSEVQKKNAKAWVSTNVNGITAMHNVVYALNEPDFGTWVRITELIPTHFSTTAPALLPFLQAAKVVNANERTKLQAATKIEEVLNSTITDVNNKVTFDKKAEEDLETKIRTEQEKVSADDKKMLVRVQKNVYNDNAIATMKGMAITEKKSLSNANDTWYEIDFSMLIDPITETLSKMNREQAGSIASRLVQKLLDPYVTEDECVTASNKARFIRALAEYSAKDLEVMISNMRNADRIRALISEFNEKVGILLDHFEVFATIATKEMQLSVCQRLISKYRQSIADYNAKLTGQPSQTSKGVAAGRRF